MHAFLPGVLFHALAIAVVAFFILFAASKAEGFVRLLGNLLGWIILLAAILFLAMAGYDMTTGQRPPWLERAHGWMMRGSENGAARSLPAPPASPNEPPATPPSEPQRPH